MESSASAPVMVSPSSDERFWGKLRDRVDTILEHRRPKRPSPSPTSASSAALIIGVESEAGKRFREDSLLLIRGLDSAAVSLSQLTSSLNAAQQGLCDLAKPSLTNLQHRESHGTEDEDAQPNAKRHCARNKLPNEDGEAVDEKHHTTNSEDGAGPAQSSEVEHVSEVVGKSCNLKKAKSLAISMASKAGSLARELKTIKSELCFMQERCALLEEENRRLRGGMEKGVRPEEDDLVRLQLEALLAEKSKLASDNANLTRENQCLHQLVEYHQLATQDPSSPSYEQTIRGICLDFSSPEGKLDSNVDDERNDYEESESISTPSTDKFEAISS